MTQCITYEVPCLENDYEKIDSVLARELKAPLRVEDVINESDFCAILYTDPTIYGDELNWRETLAGLNGKCGVYHLWIDVGNCQDHEIWAMLCVYVGKGVAINRVLEHAKKKWPENSLMYVTFYECENRIAKYLEQLFLDSYKFYLNENENTGTGSLFARWTEERHMFGTELYRDSEIYSRKIGPGPYEMDE